MALKIDAHSHAGVRHGATQTGKDLIKKMDSVGVDKGVIFPFTEGYFKNDEIVEYVKESPDRLIPFCAINPWCEREALDELVKCVRDLKFKGLKLHPTLCGFRLSDPGLMNPVFEIAEQYGFVIISHGASDLYNCPLEFSRIAKRFPKVPLLMAHCGYFWAVDQAIEVAKESPNLYLECSRAPMFEIKQIVKNLGPERVIWGTDAPFVDYEWEFKKMEKVTDSKQGYDLIMGGNIQRLLKI